MIVLFQVVTAMAEVTGAVAAVLAGKFKLFLLNLMSCM